MELLLVDFSLLHFSFIVFIIFLGFISYSFAPSERGGVLACIRLDIRDLGLGREAAHRER